MSTELAGIEYAGVAGSSLECQDAVVRLLQFGDRITQVRILTSPENTHCLLLTVGTGDLVAIKSGFASGYGGEGPRSFSYVLQILEAHGVEDMDEYKVDEDLIRRVDDSSLTQSDIDMLEAARPLRPRRWNDYILEQHWEQEKAGKLWEDEFPTIIPFAIVDSRLMDLALSFWDDPDGKIFTGYCRLEDVVRERIGSDEHGIDLFSETFQGKTPKLTWKSLGKSEVEGRGLLFMATYKAYRNRRAHREQKNHIREQQLTEFLLLNQLFRLEKEATSNE